jgi:broad-specificity NMP kinase
MKKKKVIVISGTPGTGKSMLAKILCEKYGCRLTKFHQECKLISNDYDNKMKSYVVDLKKFTEYVKKELKENDKRLIIDSHIAHLLPKELVKAVIVLTCQNYKVLRSRLKDKRYHKNKIEENVQAEIFQVCLLEAQNQHSKIIQYDTSKNGFNTSFLKKISKNL